ncbi:2-oxoacid decarboxylase/dehydrogenase, putative [Geotalea daltonii FRC-32]|uniref:2-oxoacid decarboxylase/dehydrogenase, putative n=1 Tax=Geotalea daltonii (strain DSM 22248 / JCM 15807 / FRC-32) TaxID=316067 RepID=B9M1T0_GEODF|nr:thiamine pyrophosphate-requiring protein [Geotalea daltonii]ACM19226.1 2-oxoacid decarboxylase/dehydrogenase, putative [Geotalea daltonii FRC-32]
MAITTSDYLVQRLMDWGVRRVYGYPGDGINGVMGALNRAQEKIRFYQARHEEEAAFMACGHAKFTGEVGICIATSGPGAIHLLNGLYDAKMDHQPVVAIVGQQATTSLGADYQQEVDLISLFKDVAHHFVQMATNPAQIRHLVDRAVRIALAERTVTCIILPNDVQELEAVESPPRKHGATFTGIGFSRPEVVPKKDDLRKAADVLNAGRKIAILVGAGALHATEEVVETAEKVGAGVAKALLGKAALPDDLPYVTGSIGLLGTKPSYELMMNCDTFLMIGSGFPYSEFLPREGQARGVQIDIDPRMLSLRYPMEVNLQGDTALTLRALLPLLEKKTDRSWQDGVEANVREWWQVMEARANVSATPINPQRLFWELSSRLPDHAIITCDSGSAANWYARDLKIRRGMMASLSGTLSTMCPGIPYALAAKINNPERVVISLVGDGAVQMLGLNGLITIAKYWREWCDPRLVIMVLNNEDLNQVTWEQRVMNGDPKFMGSQDIPAFPYARYAQMLGLEGIELRHPNEIGAAWDAALKAGKPVVIDAHCDPEVPPLPPHITFEQAKGYMFSIFKGDPNLGGMVKQSAKQMMANMLSRSEK